MFPTYNLLACLVIVDPTTGTAACGVSATMFAGIWPAACMALYCNGVMCSNPGGGTSQYREGLRLRDLLEGDLDLLLLFSRRSLDRERERRRSRDRDLRRRSTVQKIYSMTFYTQTLLFIHYYNEVTFIFTHIY